MANQVRKTRSKKEETVRFRFASAQDSKAVEERLSKKSSLDFTRTGRTITIPASKIKVLDNAASAEGVTGNVVAGRGRPRADDDSVKTVGVAPKAGKVKSKSKKSKKDDDSYQRLSKHIIEGGKKKANKFVVLCPAATDAKKLAKQLGEGVKTNGARVVITGGDEKSNRLAVRSIARTLSIPIALEDGFEKKDAKKNSGKILHRDAAEAVEGLPEKNKLGAKKTKRGNMRLRPTSLRKNAKPKKADALTAAKSSKSSKSARTKPIWRLNVESSTILTAWYNPQSERLKLEFKNGSKYLYEDVSIEEFTEFTMAESQGEFFHEHFKDDKECRKVKSN